MNGREWQIMGGKRGEIVEHGREGLGRREKELEEQRRPGKGWERLRRTLKGSEGE